MEHKAFYRKYRPKNLNEVVGQEIIVETLRKSIDSDKISHAYLFSGPKGTGKTSLAKLFSKNINCLSINNGDNCGKCANCLMSDRNAFQDVIELDAASNNGVDEIREIKSKVDLVPNHGKYKIYIIDEVHMLSTGAFNALLKTLEEPPAHVIFILATTEMHKIPETVKSRCQIFSFRKITEKKVTETLNRIVVSENLNIGEDVLKEIAIDSNGSLRDGIGLLDQIKSMYDTPTLDQYKTITGKLTNSELALFIISILNSDYAGVKNQIESYYESGKDLIKIYDQLLFYLKDNLFSIYLKDGVEYKIKDPDTIKMMIEIILDNLDRVVNSQYPRIIFEIVILSLIELFQDKKVFPGKYNEVESELNISKTEEKITVKPTASAEVIIKKEALPPVVVEESIEVKIKTNKDEVSKNSLKLREIIINNTLALASKEVLFEIKEIWNNINSLTIDSTLGPVAGLLLDSSVKVASTKNVIIAYLYSSMVDRLEFSIEQANKIVTDVIGRDYKIVSVTEEEWSSIQDEYIGNYRKGIKYEYIDATNVKVEKDEPIINETSRDNTIIAEEPPKGKDKVDELKEMFGDKIIKIK